MKFSKQLQDWREREKLTQDDAAKIIGVPQNTLENWEQERNTPNHFVQQSVSARISQKNLTEKS